MGKRTKQKTDEELKSKIKRLKKELLSRQKANEIEDIEYDSYYGYDEYVSEDPPEMGTELTDVPSAPIILPEICENKDKHTSSVVIEETELTSVQFEENLVPSEILAVLGVAKSSEECFGAKIPKEISERWGNILVEGLVKEQKEGLLAKILFPENFQLAKAPKLNPEVMSILNEPVKNRDKRLEKMQNQLSTGIAGLANLTADLIAKDLEKIDIIKKISEITQTLLDLHYEETMNRRRLIIPILDKSFINIIQGVKREKYLFGDNLGDNIRNTKSIEKSSLQIKKSLPSQPSTYRRPTTSAPQGNPRAPPRQASWPGAARTPLAQARYCQQPPPQPAARRPPPGPRRPGPPPPPRPQDRRGRR